jgi:hypothetical protein
MNQYFAENDYQLSRCSVVSYGGIADVGGVLVMQKSENSTYIVFLANLPNCTLYELLCRNVLSNMNQYFAESDNLLSRCSVVSYGGIADVGGVLVMQKSENSTYIVFLANLT